jgi:integrase
MVAAGVGYQLHDLRHFYTSGLIAAGCDVVTVQRALGHSSAAETLKSHAHLWPDASDCVTTTVPRQHKPLLTCCSKR